MNDSQADFKIVSLFVSALNGRTTKGDNPDVHGWTSAEDGEHFRQVRDECDVIIIGRKTYDAMQLQPEPGKLRVVFTSNPETYADREVDGQLEFTKESPAELVSRLRGAGYRKVLLAAGSQVSSLFLAAGLIDELYLTYEPVIFGSGNLLFAGAGIDSKLELVSIDRLNDRGSLLAHYNVIKN